MRGFWLALCGATAVLCGGALALALSGPFGTPPRVIAFGGTLDQNGLGVNGDVPMTFYILTSEAAPVTAAVWQEDYPAAAPVSVVGGRFQVALGGRTAGTGIPDAVLQNGELYVAVSVNGIELAGRQRLLATPFAITAAQARDFTVNGVLTVNGNVAATGNIRAGGFTDLGTYMKSCYNVDSCACNAGDRIINGGPDCELGGGNRPPVLYSHPLNLSSWYALCVGSPPLEIRIVCARIR
jgi:hypothetical protein